VNLPPPTMIFATGPHCTGTPTYTTCATCGSVYGCSGTATGYCQGCTFQTAGGGTCLGTLTPCAQLSPTACSLQPGCSLAN
jgi:hypothetical protein